MWLRENGWLLRKLVYTVVLIAGIVLIMLGKADSAQVDGWLTQAGSITAALCGGLALANTKPPAPEHAGHTTVESVMWQVAEHAATMAVNSIAAPGEARSIAAPGEARSIATPDAHADMAEYVRRQR